MSSPSITPNRANDPCHRRSDKRTPRLLALELPLTALGTEHQHHVVPDVPGEDLPIIKAILACGTPETFVVPLPAQSPDVLPNDGLAAFPALGSSPLGAFCLTVDAPRVAVLLDVRHSLSKGVATLGTEEVPVVPMLSECNDVFAKDWSRAVLAAGGEELMPIEMTIEPEALITVLGHCLSRLLLEGLPCSATVDAIQSGGSAGIWLRADFKGLQRGAT